MLKWNKASSLLDMLFMQITNFFMHCYSIPLAKQSTLGANNCKYRIGTPSVIKIKEE